jgi:hypothetical protein
MPAVRQRRRGALGGRARGNGPRPARTVRAGVPGPASGIPATAGVPAAPAGISGSAGVWSAAAPVVRLSLAVVVGVPLGPAVDGLPGAAAPASATAGLFGPAAAGLQRPEASQPVVQGQFDEQLIEQQERQ